MLENSNSLPLVTSATTSSHPINGTIYNTVTIPPNRKVEIQLHFADSQYKVGHIQQWKKMIVNNGILYRHYARPRKSQDYLQLVVPTEIRKHIL